MHLALMAGYDNNLVLCKLDGTSLVNIDMSTIYCNYALILVEHRVDNRGVGLCASCKEEDVSFIILTSLLYQFLCPHATLVSPVGLSSQFIGLNQFLEYFWMCSVTVVVVK